MIKSVHHVSYTVSDMDRSLRFYEEGLGFERYSDRTVEGSLQEIITGIKNAKARIVHLKGHGQGLELFQYFAPEERLDRAVRPCDVGSSHMCFQVSDIDDIVRYLKGIGADFLSEPQTVEAGPNAGNRFCYFLDPDGIPMELTQRAGE